MFTTRIETCDKGYGVRFPKAVIDQLGLAEGSQFIVQPTDGGILLIPIESKQPLDDILAQITPQQLHEETDFGRAIGKEVW